MDDFDVALSEEIWELAKKGLPEGCWNPCQVAAFIRGDRPVSPDMIRHLKDCESCQITLIARHANRAVLDDLFSTIG